MFSFVVISFEWVTTDKDNSTYCLLYDGCEDRLLLLTQNHYVMIL